MADMKHLSFVDQLFAQADRALRTVAAPAPAPVRANPAHAASNTDELSDAVQRAHAAGLMRVNHTGEVCAQALYFGHAATARSVSAKQMMLEAAAEEGDHLSWCESRLRELNARPSLLNPIWYAGSFALGAISSAFGDRVGLGFIAETEAQVEAHLGEHQSQLPADDARSRAIVAQMKIDEAEHGAHARAQGAVDLPWPIPQTMRRVAALMKRVAYKI
jgi:3-demethoxyubiquinol 3-hydroxylase